MEPELLIRLLPELHGQLPGSLELAYLGDAVFELYVRSDLVARGGHVRAMHHAAVDRVNAHAQATALMALLPILSEEELAVVRRARNAHQNPPRNADPGEYHLATALEALVGYLTLTGAHDRLDALMKRVLAPEGD